MFSESQILTLLNLINYTTFSSCMCFFPKWQCSLDDFVRLRVCLRTLTSKPRSLARTSRRWTRICLTESLNQSKTHSKHHKWHWYRIACSSKKNILVHFFDFKAKTSWLNYFFFLLYSLKSLTLFWWVEEPECPKFKRSCSSSSRGVCTSLYPHTCTLVC